ncbi:SRPBCC family protein, partial [Acinetobacter baumannii]
TIEALAHLWTVTNQQDKELAENNQKGVNSPGYTPGPYSRDAEMLALRFTDWYCDTARSYLQSQAVDVV